MATYAAFRVQGVSCSLTQWTCEGVARVLLCVGGLSLACESPNSAPQKPLSAKETARCLIVGRALGFKFNTHPSCQLPSVQVSYMKRCWRHPDTLLP